MKGVKVFTIIVFAAILIVPLALFNFKPDAVSEIDNRKLADSPFGANADKSQSLTTRMENYVNDRIGLRDEMILGYTVVNDVVFNKMVHPSYTYGKDGYVFGAGIMTKNDFGEFHTSFADMVSQMQAYCNRRKIPFLFVLNPSKPAILTKKLPSSINYDRSSITQFVAELKKRGVNYVDNTETLQKLSDSGTEVFNKKYDANHWNETGAYYGTLNSLQKLKETCPNVHINEESEFDITTETKTSLPVSKFPINEKVPVYTPKITTWSKLDKYEGLPFDKDYHNFDYVTNNVRKQEGCPRALVFQGSYMNTGGHKFYENAFGECIQIHSYNNVIDFPSYFNIFQPDCVVFEVTDYAIKPDFFNFDRMKGLTYNIPFSALKGVDPLPRPVSYDSFDIKKNDNFTVISWRSDESFDDVWLKMDNVYDMVKTKNGYTVIVPTKEKDNFTGKLQVLTYKDRQLCSYS